MITKTWIIVSAVTISETYAIHKLAPKEGDLLYSPCINSHGTCSYSQLVSSSVHEDHSADEMPAPRFGEDVNDSH